MILGIALAIAGALLLAVAMRMWTGRYYEDANPWFLWAVPYGSQPWTMPLPMAGYGLAFIGVGAFLLVPRALIGVCVIVMVIGGLIAVAFLLWQPSWSVPPSLRRPHS